MSLSTYYLLPVQSNRKGALIREAIYKIVLHSNRNLRQRHWLHPVQLGHFPQPRWRMETGDDMENFPPAMILLILSDILERKWRIYECQRLWSKRCPIGECSVRHVACRKRRLRSFHVATTLGPRCPSAVAVGTQAFRGLFPSGPPHDHELPLKWITSDLTGGSFIRRLLLSSCCYTVTESAVQIHEILLTQMQYIGVHVETFLRGIASMIEVNVSRTS